MNNQVIPQSLVKLSEKLPKPLYITGGYVRNMLLGIEQTGDVDICSPIPLNKFLGYLTGFIVLAIYPRTNTARIEDDQENVFEFTSFRIEKYEAGMHAPVSVELTEDIGLDALRRDFKCNALYYNVLSGELTDNVGGKADIEKKLLSAVTDPEAVFKDDGLRLMRLARFSAELNFSIEEKTLKAAKDNKSNITDISKERIYDELKKILVADETYSISDKDAVKRGLSVLGELELMPLITGSDVYEDKALEKLAINAVCRVKNRENRLAALLYIVYRERGAAALKAALDKLVVGNTAKNRATLLVEGAYYATPNKDELRLFISKNYYYISDLIDIRRAISEAEKSSDTSVILQNEWDNMQKEGCPVTVKDLKIKAEDLMDIGIFGEEIGTTLDALFYQAVVSPRLNTKKKLLELADRLRA